MGRNPGSVSHLCHEQRGTSFSFRRAWSGSPSSSVTLRPYELPPPFLLRLSAPPSETYHTHPSSCLVNRATLSLPPPPA